MKNVSRLAGLVAFLLVPGRAPADPLRPPASTLSWLLGHWTCEAYDYDSGEARRRKGLVRAYFFSGPGGLTVLGRSLFDGKQQNDRITWNEPTRRWLDVDVEAGATNLQSALLAEDVDVTSDGMTFTGKQRMGAVIVDTMVATTRTGQNRFTEKTEFFENEDWQVVDRTDCTRDRIAVLAP